MPDLTTVAAAPARSADTHSVSEPRLVLSCEHGGNAVPPDYQNLFSGARAILDSHRGYDPGALALARRLAAALSVPLEAAHVTRLLVDHNRSLHNRRALFSAFSRGLPAAERERLLRDFYHPYRDRVAARVDDLLDGGHTVVHVAVHSFTPRLHGTVRNADLGLLYDPARQREAAFCRRWQKLLEELAPPLRVRRNYPYRGASDALVTWLRRRLPARRYLGLELEVNQALAAAGEADRERLAAALGRSLRTLLSR